MTVEKGVDWGRAGKPPEDLIVVHSDAEARAAIISARAVGRRFAGDSTPGQVSSERFAGDSTAGHVSSERFAGDSTSDAPPEEDREGAGRLPTLGLLGGDLARTLGGRGGDPARLREAGTLATVDLGIAILDGVAHPFVAHVIARRSWWRGRLVAVMNAQFLGAWDLAPRGHPGDGRLDVLDADLGLGDRWKARSRLPAGTHVPHPDIHQTRTARWDTTFARPTPVRLDGELVGRFRRLEVRVEPDALTVVV